ncbi:MAG: YdcF family protein [Betaproteobacteria bacterium]|nr:MAG: YdcF family protein [Betaproteobacteria bacterium]
MNTSWLITNLLAVLLLPPLNLLLLALIGLWLMRRRRTLGKILIIFSFIGLWLLSTPYVAKRYLAAFEAAPLVNPTGHEADAIVILGGGKYRHAPEFGNDSIKGEALERLHYGAWLAQRVHKPLLVSGGAPDGGPAEALIMKTVLERDFHTPVRWVEGRSNNTRENALYSAQQLKAAGIGRIYLVSQAWHLPRAIPEFERAGLVVVPAGTGFVNTAPTTPLDFLPNGGYLKHSYHASHEAIGRIWYGLHRLIHHKERNTQ